MLVAGRIPVIDIFAGPGGLGEGFASFKSPPGTTVFDIRLSVENSEVAVETLKLRKFYRSFNTGRVPEDYYKYIRGEIPRSILEAYPEWELAATRAVNLTLGSEADREAVHSAIEHALNGAKDFVLIGGPPCQAYSLVGRARMTGIGKLGRAPLHGKTVKSVAGELLDRFHADARHTLYRSYLEILAIHTPAVFVMENVKGILSSRLKLPDGSYENTFSRILADLENPHQAIASDAIAGAAQRVKLKEAKYILHPLIVHEDENRDLFGADKSWTNPAQFVVKSEEYGVPQRRHRVIVLGVRADIQRSPGKLARRESISVHDAISDLPSIRSRISPLHADSEENWIGQISDSAREIAQYLTDPSARRTLSRIQKRRTTSLIAGSRFISAKLEMSEKTAFKKWVYDKRLGGFIQHEARSHMPDDLKRYLYLTTAASINSNSGRQCLTLDRWPTQLLPAHENVLLAKENLSSMVFKDRFRVQYPNEPSTTITSHISKDGHYFIHYSPMQCRSLTVREAARLQTFPDNYFFEGGRTDQYKQVGNAVPPFLAFQIARIVARVLEAK